MALSKKKQLVIKAYEKKLMNVSAACREIGISRKTFYNWVNEDEEFKEAYEDAKESIKDALEHTMIGKALQEQDNTMLIFLAKTKMKDRGYSERVEITGAEGGPMKHEYNGFDFLGPPPNLPDLENDSEE